MYRIVIRVACDFNYPLGIVFLLLLAIENGFINLSLTLFVLSVEFLYSIRRYIFCKFYIYVFFFSNVFHYTSKNPIYVFFTQNPPINSFTSLHITFSLSNWCFSFLISTLIRTSNCFFNFFLIIFFLCVVNSNRI
ncbi:hypothetical protein H311_01027 [Anncaliia algerae PRA109]|nr:hypothetical protein H311_01027 [Anncaliia algerae PRA109]